VLFKTQHPLAISAAAIAVTQPSWHPDADRLVPRSSVTVPWQFASRAVPTVVHPSGVANVAVTVVAAVTDTVQVVALPEQPPPDQAANT
jgi:hypothetical protein